MDVVIEGPPKDPPKGPPKDPEVGPTVYRTFEDGTSIERYTLFVQTFIQEDGIWKRPFAAEENASFQPGVPYEDLVASQ